MKKFLFILTFFASCLNGESIDVILQRIEQYYRAEHPNYEIIREQVGILNQSIAQNTYPFKQRAQWWNEPSDTLLSELENIANILAPYEEMLVGLAYYEGIQQGFPTTLTTLLNAKPTETLKTSLEDYLFGDYSSSIPARSLLVLYELDLADDELYGRLFQDIVNRDFKNQDFHTLSLLASRKDPVNGMAEAFLNLLQKQTEEYQGGSETDIIELAIIAMAYSKMIDGMGAEMAEVALELERLVSGMMNGEYRTEILAIYPNLEEYTASVIKRIRNDHRVEVPPLGYGLVVDNPSDSKTKSEILGDSTMISTPAQSVVKNDPEASKLETEAKMKTDRSMQWLKWLLLTILAIVGIGCVIKIRRK
jgi:hypothetical protein